MRIIKAEQRSPEWFQARLGVPSASSFGKVITPTGKPSMQVDGYRNKLVAEILTGRTDGQEASEAMQRGTDMEPEARSYYELIAGPVQEIGFCIHDDGFGCSPDGLVGDDGLLEIKCPLSHTQVEYLRDGKIPGIYYPQVQGQLLVMGRKWCDFISYHPDMKPLIVRVERDKKFIDTLHGLLIDLVTQVKLDVERCRK